MSAKAAAKPYECWIVELYSPPLRKWITSMDINYAFPCRQLARDALYSSQNYRWIKYRVRKWVEA